VRHAATVERLFLAGFQIGPPAVERCETCECLWGPHTLHPIDDDHPLRGGTYRCPVEDCGCTGTWAVVTDSRGLSTEAWLSPDGFVRPDEGE
jgi:hypothetical protein